MKLSVRMNQYTVSIQQQKAALRLWFTIGFIALNFVTVAAANETTLNLKPAQCIAIHQGKMCYVDIELQWQAQDKGEYCLYSSQQTEPLKCWRQTNHGQFEREIVTRHNVIFQLRQEKPASVLISKELEMAWVYKRNAKARSSWRMF